MIQTILLAGIFIALVYIAFLLYTLKAIEQVREALEWYSSEHE